MSQSIYTENDALLSVTIGEQLTLEEANTNPEISDEIATKTVKATNLTPHRDGVVRNHLQIH